MGKIGRNEMCPCGSGQKYKKCCLGKEAAAAANAPEQAPKRVTLRSEIEKIQQSAVDGQGVVRDMGVFILFSIEAGDAWLLEVTESDALHVAAAGEKIDFDLEENPETIEVEWSHTFAINNKQFEVTSYKDKQTETYKDYPAHAIAAAVKRIKKKFSPELLDSVHVEKQ